MNNRTIQTNKHHPEVEQIALMIPFVERWKLTESKGLELDEILTICAQAWEVLEETIKQKIQHNKYRILKMQYSFMWAATYYSNSYNIHKYLHCRDRTVWEGKDLMNTRIKNKDHEYPQLLKIINACEKRCPGRIKSNFKLGLEYGEIRVSEGQDFFRLNQYQVNTIPVRDLSWFLGGKGSFGLFTVAAYRLGENICKQVSVKTRGEREHLFMLQSFGYRFIVYEYEEKQIYKKRNPICDKCVKKNDCPLMGEGYGLFFMRGSDQYKCFIPLDNIKKEIAIELLYPIEKYQLQ